MSDPNRAGSDEERQYIARLVGRVVTVRVETVRLVGELAGRVDLLAAVGAGVAGPDGRSPQWGTPPPDAPTHG